MLSKRVRVVGEKEWRIFEFEEEERGLGASGNQEGVWGGVCKVLIGAKGIGEGTRKPKPVF